MLNKVASSADCVRDDGANRQAAVIDAVHLRAAQRIDQNEWRCGRDLALDQLGNAAYEAVAVDASPPFSC